MKKNLFPQTLFFVAFVFSQHFLTPTLAASCYGYGTSPKSLAENSSILLSDEDGPGIGGKKKSKKKKMSRRKCIYCPTMRVFEKGQWEANFGLGLVPTYLMDEVTVIMPPMSLGADYRFSEKISLGARFGSSVSKSKSILVADGIGATWTNSHFVLGIRPAFHLTSIENWDFYGGFSVGANYSNIVGNASNPKFDLKEKEYHMGIEQHNFSTSFFGFTGVKFAINPKWAAYGEVSFGISIFSVGASYLLNAKSKS